MAAVVQLPAMIRAAPRATALLLLLPLLLLPLYEPVAGMKKGMFRRRNRPGTGDSSAGGDGENRNWPWDALNATELEGRSFEYQIKAAVMAEYQKASRPVLMDGDAVKVFVGFSLFHILDTDEKYQTMKSLISVRLRWTDQYLQWDPDEFGNTTKIWMYASSIWLPDILISNYADDDYKEIINTNVIVNHDGSVLWMYPMVTKTYCEFDVERFPFDRQVCNVSFFSWTFSSRLLDLRIDNTQANNNFYNPHGQEWLVSSITSFRELQIYVCCKDDPFPIITYSIHMQRRSLFYVLNLIFPCLLIYCCAFLGFFLPVESGEKVNLEITILLALVVFLIIAGEVLPPTPDVLPLLGLLYGSSMAMVSIALVMAVVVTNLHFAADTRPPRPVPGLLQRLSSLILHGGLVPGWHRVRSRSRHRRRRRLLCQTSTTSRQSSTPYTAADDRCGRRLARSALAGATSLPEKAFSRDSSPCGGGDTLDDLDDDVETPLGRQLTGEASAAAEAAARSGGVWSLCCQLITSAKLGRLSNDREDDQAGSVAQGDWRTVAKAADRMFFWTFLGITVALMGYMLACALAA